MANIITTVSAENNVRMTNAQCARAPIAAVFTSWSVLRIAARVRIADTGAAISGPPLFGMGLCSGNTNILGDATTTHFVGVMSSSTDQATWPRTAGPPVVYEAQIYPKKRITSTYTEGSGRFTVVLFQFHTGYYKLLFAEITKGSPNYSFKLFYPQIPSAVDATSANFLTQAVVADSACALANHTYGTTRTLAVDEGANGTLDHACLWWNQAGSTIDIADFQVYKIA